jgi:hypothetical protein
VIPALNVNLLINQGSKFEQPILVRENGVAVDLTDYTARMQVREWKDSTTVLLELTTENGGIILTPTVGLVTLYAHGDETAALDFGDGVYDVEIVEPAPGADPIRIMEGRVSLSREVTR